MGSRLGRFDYKILGGRKAQKPTSATVQIYLARPTKSEHGAVQISPDLMTPAEIPYSSNGPMDYTPLTTEN